MQFRHIRLRPAEPSLPVLLAGWQPQPAPGGWSETNRLRPGLAQDFWLTGNRPGELWYGASIDSPNLENRAANQLELVFNDILPTATGQLVATNVGLWWRSQTGSEWQPVAGGPANYAYTVAQAGERYYAGFETEGLWSAAAPNGPWQRTTLTPTTVLDLAAVSSALPGQMGSEDRLYVVTGSGIFVNDGPNSGWRLLTLPGLSGQELADAGESTADKLKPRLFPLRDGRLLVRHQDRFWLQDVPDSAEWVLFGPEQLHGKLYSVQNCCGVGTLVGTNDAGLWQLTAAGTWQRIDGSFFNTTDTTELLAIADRLFAAGVLGLFHSVDGRQWQKVTGLPATVTDIVVDPGAPSRWIAGTPAGLFRSQDGGRSWVSISPPWVVWDLAFGAQGRLYVGGSNGLAWVDDLGAGSVPWQAASDMAKVFFLGIKPHPTDPNVVWTGTWGNNIAISEDGGRSVTPLHNGLETLSGLDLIWHPTPGQVTLATFEGLYRTDDGGPSWFKLPGPLAQQTIFALLQTDDGAIWAGATGGLWVSRDYGVTWSMAQNMAEMTVLQLGRLEIPLTPSTGQDPSLKAAGLDTLVNRPQEWLWAGTEKAGLWLSQDNGAMWHFAGLDGRSIYNVFFDPLVPRRLVAATDQGIYSVSVSAEVLAVLSRP
jgi:photosystem II stability/assembly factor-like uncharacterized protein